MQLRGSASMETAMTLSKLLYQLCSIVCQPQFCLLSAPFHAPSKPPPYPCRAQFSVTMGQPHFLAPKVLSKFSHKPLTCHIPHRHKRAVSIAWSASPLSKPPKSSLHPTNPPLPSPTCRILLSLPVMMPIDTALLLTGTNCHLAPVPVSDAGPIVQ